MRWRCLTGEWDALVTLLAEAMRYYCLWIYACNAVLLVSVIVFLAYAATVSSDYRLAFVPHIKFYHPTLLYAYVAVVVQGGVIQALGCYAARRLNERLLNIYWLLLLVLIIGDAVVGIVWILRYDKICQEMIPLLHKQLVNSYGIDVEFTRRWDRLQVESKCCGIFGPLDYNSTVSFTYIGEGGPFSSSSSSSDTTNTDAVGVAASAAAATVMGAAALIADADGDMSGGAETLTFFVPVTCCHPSQALPLHLMTFNSAAAPSPPTSTASDEDVPDVVDEPPIVTEEQAAAERRGNQRKPTDDRSSIPHPDARFDSYHKTEEDNWPPEEKLDAWLAWLEEKRDRVRGSSADPTEDSTSRPSHRSTDTDGDPTDDADPHESQRQRRSTHRHRHWQKTSSRQLSASQFQHQTNYQQLSPLGSSDGTYRRSVGAKDVSQLPTPGTLFHNFTCRDGDLAPYLEPRLVGCGPELVAWVSKSADTLFVLGFCVIAFIKICFLGLLRYEIKEMIQKIKMLRCEGEEGARQNEFAEIAAAFGAAAATQAQTTAATANHVPFVPTPQSPYPPPNPLQPATEIKSGDQHEAQLNHGDEATAAVASAANVANNAKPQHHLFATSPSAGPSPSPSVMVADVDVVVVPGDGQSSSDSSRSPLLGGRRDSTSRCFSDDDDDDDRRRVAGDLKACRPSLLVMPPSTEEAACSSSNNNFSFYNEMRENLSAEDKNRRLREELHEMSELLRITGRQTEI